VVTVTVTAKFHNSSLSRRKEWQYASRLYRETRQFCIDGWENGDFGESVATTSIDRCLCSAIQDQAIPEAKCDADTSGETPIGVDIGDVDGPRGSVLEAGGNAQSAYPLWGILAP